MTHVYRSSSKLSKVLLAIALTHMFTACVTVNVNFPESAVQKASDDFVKDLYRAKEKPKTSAPTSDTGKPKPPISALFDVLIPSAHADEDTFKLETPNSGAIKARMAERLNGSLAKYKADGFVGERADGLVEVTGEPGPALKKRIEAVVADENKDRKQYYDELKTVNPRATTEMIRRSFSKSFQSESPSGSMVESAPGTWEKKR